MLTPSQSPHNKSANRFTSSSHQGKVAEAWGTQRPRPNNGGAGSGQILDLAKQLGRHGTKFGQDQNAIAHSIGQDKTTIFDRHASEQHFRRAGVEVVTQTVRRVALCCRGRRAKDLRRILGFEETHIGYKQGLVESINWQRAR